MYIMGKNYILGSETTVHPSIIKWAESLKDTAGIYCTSFRDQRIYLITAGERPTGGFRITVKDQGADTVAYRVEEPGHDDFVIQIITYPYELILPVKGQLLRFYKLEKGKSREVKPQLFPPLGESG